MGLMAHGAPIAIPTASIAGHPGGIADNHRVLSMVIRSTSNPAGTAGAGIHSNPCAKYLACM